MKDKIARAGTLLILESGEWDDYGVEGFAVVLKDFAPVLELNAFLEEHPEQNEYWKFEKDAYVGYLVSKGYLMFINYGRLYLGDYHAYDNVEFHPVDE